VSANRGAVLVLRDGRAFRGRALGAAGEAAGEVIFNTAMSGYQEILTDPSYRGQIVTMTYPMIGNYGLNEEDVESRRPWVNGLIVKEASACPSSWRGRVGLDAYLRAHGIVGLEGIDTRALTRHLRDRGAQDGIISSVELDLERLNRLGMPGSLRSLLRIDKTLLELRDGPFKVIPVSIHHDFRRRVTSPRSIDDRHFRAGRHNGEELLDIVVGHPHAAGRDLLRNG